jgi:hypothetical protein
MNAIWTHGAVQADMVAEAIAKYEQERGLKVLPHLPCMSYEPVRRGGKKRLLRVKIFPGSVCSSVCHVIGLSS